MSWLPLLLLACCTHMSSSTSSSSSDYLLPGNVVPYHYHLRLLYDIDPDTKFSFYAVVDILLTAKKPTSEIVLHMQDFNISENNITLSGDNSNVPKVNSIKNNASLNFLILNFDENLEENTNYTLTIPFHGRLSTGLDGVYVSSYLDTQTNVKEYLIATQFEAISARKGFPCFDEPIYKATYSIDIGHHKHYTAISNMPMEKTSDQNSLENYWPWSIVSETFKKPESEFQWVQFHNSVPMSTYLVAFVISKFGYAKSEPCSEKCTTEFKTWARKDAIDQCVLPVMTYGAETWTLTVRLIHQPKVAQRAMERAMLGVSLKDRIRNDTAYAAKIGPQVLAFYEEYFGVPFPLPKQDMVAIPDFAAGAMENWGLITYRETALLYDQERSSFVNKERVAEVIAHELAHQWFGNLVTMKWWSDLWLNEGFATHMATVGMNRVEPDWHALINNAVENTLIVLKLDALQSSHPVSVPLDNPKRISEIFDEISYRKGSALIRMMSMFLGEDVFKDALHQYIVKYSYKNAEQDDLWQELTDVASRRGTLPSDMSVKEVMDTWTTQTGVPLLTVTRNYEDDTLELSQKRLLHSNAKTDSTFSWWIPLRIMDASEVNQPLKPVQWLAKHQGFREPHKMSRNTSASDWILFNADMIAPYRVNYDEKNWQALTTTLLSEKYTDIPITGRVQLLSDAFMFAWNDMVSYDVALSLVSYLERETEYLPISVGLKALSPLDNMLQRTSGYGAFQKFVRKLITSQYEKGGLAKKMILNDTDLNSVKMQVLISGWACKMGVPGCESNAMELFSDWMSTENPDTENPIPLDLRRVVYCVAIRRGSVAEWRFALQRLQRSNVAAEREQLMSALTCSRETWILIQYLEWTITKDSVIRQQDMTRVIGAIAGSSVGFYVAKDFVYERIQDIYDAMNGQGRRMGGLIKILLGEFTRQSQLDEFLTWKEKNGKYLEESTLAVSQAIEAAKVNINWLERHQKNVVEKLRKFTA